MNILTLAAIFVSNTIIAMLATGVLLPWLRRREMVDLPNQRSSHASPTLYGGGVAVSSVVCLSFTLICFNPFDWNIESPGPKGVWLVLGMSVLALLSWLDDIQGLSAGIRLLVHFLVVLTLPFIFFEDRYVFPSTSFLIVKLFSQFFHY